MAPYNHGARNQRDRAAVFIMFLVTKIAENMLIIIPTAKVMAKPLTMLVVKVARIKQVIKVEALPSLMDDQARLNPSSMADKSGRPPANSSLRRSKIKTLASTAMPKERMKPAIPDNVRVTGTSLNKASVTAP